MSSRRRCPLPGVAAVAGVAIVLLAMGCVGPVELEETDAATGAGGGNERIQRLADAGDWSTLAHTSVRCRGRSEACAVNHATKGDACLRLAIQQPPRTSTRNARLRKLLDCAESAYRQALDKTPEGAAPARLSYHDALLLTLSERRNRLDVERGNGRQEQVNDQLLMAAQAARREAPGSALGFLYGASAHVYRAALKPTPRHRCNDLRLAESLLRRSPPPPPTLRDEFRRISGLVTRELRESRCPRIRRL
jgi:hypothetical protein